MTVHEVKETLLQRLARYGYSLALLLLVLPVAVFRFLLSLLTGSQDALRRQQRLGAVPTSIPQESYLFHCVSVGEVVAASVVIKQLRNRYPQTPVVVSTTTTTGAQRVRDIFGDEVHHCYMPYDAPGVISRWLGKLNPKAIVITEVELWPNLIHRAFKRDCPVAVINARMTERSAQRYAKISALFTPMLNKLTMVCAQGERDYNNYRMLGMAADRLTLTQNIKFDQVAASAQGADNVFMGLHRSERPVIVGGSTHDPEETMLLQTLSAIQGQVSDLLLILVPRHPQRFDSVAALLEGKNVRYVRSSQSSCIPADCQVVLLDEMGRLNEAYQIASVAFVGGSFAPRGGHNALEPAAAGVPVIMGPHTENNPVICQTLAEQGALVMAHEPSALTEQCLQWLTNPKKADDAGTAGLRVLHENSGALARTLTCLSQVLDEK